MSCGPPSVSAIPFVTSGTAVMPPLPVKVATPAPSRLIQASSVKVAAPRCGAGPNVTAALVPPRWMAELAALDDPSFRALFSKSPVKRIGRDRFVRNVLYAIGNSGDAAMMAVVEPLLADPSPMVRGAAVWATGRLAPERRATLRPGLAETDESVLAEWG